MMFIANRNDPEMIKLRRKISLEKVVELKKRDKEKDYEDFDNALATDDSRSLTRLLNKL